ncbi:MAG TPA: prolyl oligopeptidase family serine peptidase [Streptosporangiaceae bacterium]|nr:prolyl oligopeptidase family serine peptidase [Streptosporangiaceae bacterium]
MPFLTPDADVVSIIDAAPTPLASPSPNEQFAILLHYQAHPPIAMLARPRLSLAGLRLDPQIAGRQRTRRFTGLSVLRISDGSEQLLVLPEGAQVSVPVWAPDGLRFAFTVDEPDGIGVWTGDVSAGSDPVQVPGLRVRDVLGAEPPGLGGAVRWSRDGRCLYVLGSPQEDERGGSAPSIEPRVSEVAGKKSQMATFQDLLTSPSDEDLFEALATTAPLRVDPESGATTRLGADGLYQYIGESPDGTHLLVYRLQRPFSFRVPYGYFARRVEVWSSAGDLVRIIADLPVSDEVPRMGVPTGPRQVSWDERAPASLIWTEALDGGDPVAPAQHRDAIMRQHAPFSVEPELAFRVAHRCLDWANLDEPGAMLLTEHDRDRRWLTTWLCYPAEPDRNTVVFDLAEDDSYADPGAPMMRLNPDGTRTIRQDGSAIFLRGEGATPEGERPFLDRRDLRTGTTTRLLQSPADAHEAALCFVAGRTDEAVIWHESPAEPPNLWVVALTGDATPRQLTSWPDPHPWLTGMRKQLVSTDRGDGVQLSGLLHTPPGYDPDSDGPLPLVIWAYPHDFGSAGTAGQIRGSSTRFTRLTASDPAWFVLRGYAVLVNATMPVIGDPETKNDTYIEQITAAATAHIKGMTAAGVADPARVAVGGHSYGAFMTANLLAHTDLFATGIARSGAYNRTLTPFGFQTERRSYWEVPEIYDRVSPFRYADQIRAPILLVHGADDANSGTFPVQSERLFQAIGGNGGTAKLVILPLESHGYLARESVLHVLAEQFSWLDRWLGPAD